jgi:hypothetical protein
VTWIGTVSELSGRRVWINFVDEWHTVTPERLLSVQHTVNRLLSAVDLYRRAITIPAAPMWAPTREENKTMDEQNTFNVGDIVNAASVMHNGQVEILAGPFDHSVSGPNSYLATRLDGVRKGKASIFYGRQLSPLPVVPEFKAGDRVIIDGARAEIAYGPVPGMYDRKMYALVRFQNGWHSLQPVSNLAPDPDANKYPFAGTVYDLTRPLVDEDGDEWKFTGERLDNGMPLFNLFVHGNESSDLNYRGRTLDRVVHTYNATQSPA